jgi:uncharacterized membrane protein
MKLEQLIGVVLRVGVIVSSVCLVAGLLLTVAFGGGPFAEFLLHAGVIILLGTPVSRVVVSIVEYSLARDWTFALLTSIVFLELLASAVAALVFNKRL